MPFDEAVGAAPTMVRFLAILCLALWPTASIAGPVTIDLGPTDEVAALYSYPNNCAEVCVLPALATLSDTIKKYLSDSLRRDGDDAANIDVSDPLDGLSSRSTALAPTTTRKFCPNIWTQAGSA